MSVFLLLTKTLSLTKLYSQVPLNLFIDQATLDLHRQVLARILVSQSGKNPPFSISDWVPLSLLSSRWYLTTLAELLARVLLSLYNLWNCVLLKSCWVYDYRSIWKFIPFRVPSDLNPVLTEHQTTRVRWLKLPLLILSLTYKLRFFLQGKMS